MTLRSIPTPLRHIRRRLSIVLVGLLCLVVASQPSLAQPSLSQGSAEDGPAFGDVLDVRLMNLEVVVTQKGERVQGLGADDFRLLVDGQEVPIEFFSEVAEGRAVTSAEQQSRVTPALHEDTTLGTRYLVFIDDFFAVPAYRNRVLRKMAEQLPILKPEDRMAVVAFDGNRVEMLSNWTRSLVQLEAAFEAASERTGYGLHRLSEQRFYDSFNRFNGGFVAGSRFANTGYLGARRGFYNEGVGGLIRGEDISWQVSQVVHGATSALRAFARPEGRKVMLLLSGGWPATPVDWVTGSFGTLGYGPAYGARLFGPLVDTANRLGYTLYPVDLDNSLRHSSVSAEYGSLSQAIFESNREFYRDEVEEDALRLLASATGGRAFLDGAAGTALERAAEDIRSYYWIGFSPRWQENDQRHRVKVEVQGKGLRVRTREGFFDLSRQTEVTMLVESAELFDLPIPGETLSVSVGEPTKAGYKRVLLPVRLEIPFDLLTTLPTANGEVAQVELRVAATDEDGDRAEIPIIPVQLTRSGGAAQVAVYETQLKLRKKGHRLLVSVYDTASGAMLSKRLEVSL